MTWLEAVGRTGAAGSIDGGTLIHACVGPGRATSASSEAPTTARPTSGRSAGTHKGPPAHKVPQAQRDPPAHRDPPAPQGPEGPPGPAGTSQAYLANSGPDFTALPADGTYGVVVSLDLPAGRYAVNAKVRLFNRSSSRSDMACVLSQAGFAGFTGTGTVVVDQFGDREATMLDLEILSSDTTIQMRCFGRSGDNQFAHFARITAIKVDSVSFRS